MAKSSTGPKVPQPPERVPVDVVVSNLRARINYVVDVLGYRPAIVALAARMSEKLLRDYDKPTWNAKLETLRKLDEAIATNMPRWIEDATKGPSFIGRSPASLLAHRVNPDS